MVVQHVLDIWINTGAGADLDQILKESTGQTGKSVKVNCEHHRLR